MSEWGSATMGLQDARSIKRPRTCRAGVEDSSRHVCIAPDISFLLPTMFADELKTLRRLGVRHVRPLLDCIGLVKT